MDLGTISDRLKAGQYMTAHAVQDDVIKVWRNVFRYEQSSSGLPLMRVTAAESSPGLNRQYASAYIFLLS